MSKDKQPNEVRPQTEFQDSASKEAENNASIKPRQPTEEERAIHFGHGNPLNFLNVS